MRWDKVADGISALVVTIIMVAPLIVGIISTTGEPAADGLIPARYEYEVLFEDHGCTFVRWQVDGEIFSQAIC